MVVAYGVSTTFARVEESNDETCKTRSTAAGHIIIRLMADIIACPADSVSLVD